MRTLWFCSTLKNYWSCSLVHIITMPEHLPYYKDYNVIYIQHIPQAIHIFQCNEMGSINHIWFNFKFRFFWIISGWKHNFPDWIILPINAIDLLRPLQSFSSNRVFLVSLTIKRNISVSTWQLIILSSIILVFERIISFIIFKGSFIFLLGILQLTQIPQIQSHIRQSISVSG